MMKKERFMIRQGDVMVVQAKAIAGEIVPSEGRVVLAFGEVTGHAHAFYADDVALHEGLPEKTRNLKLVKTRGLRHEEHSPIDIPPGVYDLPVQTEWSDDLEPRRVAD